MLKSPWFWYSNDFIAWLIALLLLPISLIYLAIVVVHRFFTKAECFSVPVIGVGGVVAGGSGKTPVTIFLIGRLKKLGKNPHIISRGYGKKNAYNEEVMSMDAERYGDEAVLLSQYARTWSGENKKSLIRFAILEGADVIVLDDGMQSFSIHKNLQVLVVNSLQKFGNHLLLPAGPLREPLFSILRRTDICVAIGPKPECIKKKTINAVLKANIDFADRCVIAFCGIGYPKKFLNTLSDLGKEIIRFVEYPDHHMYTKEDLKHLLGLSKEFSAKLVTTEKDLVKIPQGFRKHVFTVNIKIETKDDIDPVLMSLF